jgi:hypothetical protein
MIVMPTLHMKKTLALALTAAFYVFAFGVLFGSHRGVMGDLVHSMDLTLKSTIINSLAIFGFAILGFGLVIAFFGKAIVPKLGFPLLFALWLSAAYGSMFIDCAIFTFCASSTNKNNVDCEANYDKQGRHFGCR